MGKGERVECMKNGDRLRLGKRGRVKGGQRGKGRGCEKGEGKMVGKRRRVKCEKGKS